MAVVAEPFSQYNILLLKLSFLAPMHAVGRILVTSFLKSGALLLRAPASIGLRVRVPIQI